MSWAACISRAVVGSVTALTGCLMSVPDWLRLQALPRRIREPFGYTVAERQAASERAVADEFSFKRSS